MERFNTCVILLHHLCLCEMGTTATSPPCSSLRTPQSRALELLWAERSPTSPKVQLVLLIQHPHACPASGAAAVLLWFQEPSGTGAAHNSMVRTAEPVLRCSPQHGGRSSQLRGEGDFG